MENVKYNLGRIEGGAHWFPARVFYNHTDAGGVMYYANYLRVAEEARCAYLALAGGRYRGPAPGGDFVVRSCRVEYLKSAVFGDELVVKTWVPEVGKASMVWEQRVMRGDDLLAEIRIKVAYVDPARLGKPQRIPDFWLDRFKNLPD